MNIKKISLAWVSVSDLEKAKKFYHETLGLEIKECQEEWGWMEVGAAGDSFTLGIGCDKNVECPAEGEQAHEEQPVKPGDNAIVTMTVDNLDQARKELIENGVEFIGDVVEVPGEVKMIFFKDFDGNFFQLIELLKS